VTREPGPTVDSVDAVLRDLDALASTACAGCGKPICGHEALMSRMLGHRDAPRCWPCLANTLGQPPNHLRDHLQAHAAHRDCYRAGWEEASRREKCPDPLLPSCLFAAGEAPRPVGPQAATPPEVALTAGAAHAEWDAGAMGCGDLVLELRRRLRDLPPGTILKVRATDPGAPEDIPAWCGLTRHTLLGSNHPHYWIQRKEP
jgi:tRNA 2-thiouridine synthesizing protein A